MPILDGKEQERQGLMETANLMVVSARTAPKSGGRDDIFTAVVYRTKHRDTSHIISSSSPLADHLSSEKDPDSVSSPTS